MEVLVPVPVQVIVRAKKHCFSLVVPFLGESIDSYYAGAGKQLPY